MSRALLGSRRLPKQPEFPPIVERWEEVRIGTGIGDHRFVEKGVEVDLKTHLLGGDRCDWESVITYFYRGRFDSADQRVSPPASPDLSGATVVATFRTPKSGGWAFGGLTGDYNGIHT